MKTIKLAHGWNYVKFDGNQIMFKAFKILYSQDSPQNTEKFYINSIFKKVILDFLNKYFFMVKTIKQLLLTLNILNYANFAVINKFSHLNTFLIKSMNVDV